MKYPIEELPNRWSLAKLLGEGTVGCELGVLEGDHAEELFRSVKPKELHLVDYWRLAPDRPGLGADNWRKVRDRFDARIAEGVVQLHEGSFADVLKRFPDRFFDWIYIDGYHTYEATKRDIADALPKIKIGGILCGHDFKVYPEDWRTGCPRAVIEAVQNGIGPMIALSNANFADWAIKVGGFDASRSCDVVVELPEPGKGE